MSNCLYCSKSLSPGEVCNCERAKTSRLAVNQQGSIPLEHIGQPSNAKVSNVLVWFIAFIPAIGALFMFGTVLFLIVNIAMCWVDERHLQKQGFDTSSFGSTWLIPTYLYKRAKFFGHSVAYFVVWLVTFGLSIFGFFD